MLGSVIGAFFSAHEGGASHSFGSLQPSQSHVLARTLSFLSVRCSVETYTGLGDKRSISLFVYAYPLCLFDSMNFSTNE